MKQQEKNLQDAELSAVAKAIRPQLDRSEAEVSPKIAARLAQFREAAVAKAAALQTETASEVIQNGNTLSLSPGGWGSRLADWRFWATGLVVAGLIAAYAANEYNESVKARDAAEVELMILGDDVPVDALLDKGFKSFLREEN